MRKVSAVAGLLTLTMLALAACKEGVVTAGQYDELRVQLAASKELRQKVIDECLKEVAKEKPAFSRMLSVMVDAPSERAGKVFCERMVSGIANNRISYDDYSYILTALK